MRKFIIEKTEPRAASILQVYFSIHSYVERRRIKAWALKLCESYRKLLPDDPMVFKQG